jgi:hypothetical protein
MMRRINPAALKQIPSFALGLAPFFDAMNARLLGSPRVMTPELVTSIKDSIERAEADLGWRRDPARTEPRRHHARDQMSCSPVGQR